MPGHPQMEDVPELFYVGGALFEDLMQFEDTKPPRIVLCNFNTFYVTLQSYICR